MGKPQNSAGDAPVNVTEIDFGERLDQLVRDEAAKLAGSKSGGSASKTAGSRFSKFSGGYRPGMYGGFRPSWASGDRPGLSRPGDWKLGDMLKLPENVKPAAKDLLTGGLVGTVGNRVVAWVAPGIVKTNSKIATDAIAFGVGLIPYLAKRNAFTVGLALPGLFFLAGSLAEYALEKTQLLGTRPALAGLQGPHGQNPALSQAQADARRKLAEVRVRMQQARAQGLQQVPRVLARPRVA